MDGNAAFLGYVAMRLTLALPVLASPTCPVHSPLLSWILSSLSQHAPSPSLLPLAGERWDMVCVDVDNKDHTSGISSPPVQFVGKSFLDSVKAVTSKNGELRQLS